jgi:phospholipase D1/2
LTDFADPRLIHEAERAAIEAAARRRDWLLRWAWGVAIVVASAALALLWLGTPLREWLDVHRIVGAAHRIGHEPVAAIALLAAFAIGGLIVAPANILISATILVLGPLQGAAVALLGSLLSAALLYELGRRLPAQTLPARLAPVLRRVRGGPRRDAIAAVAVIRLLPVAPYSIVSGLCGAAHLDRGSYLAGTAIGMLPGIVAAALLVDRIVAAIDDPGPWTWTLLGALGVAIAAGLLVARRLLRRTAASAG